MQSVVCGDYIYLFFDTYALWQQTWHICMYDISAYVSRENMERPYSTIHTSTKQNNMRRMTEQF